MIIKTNKIPFPFNRTFHPLLHIFPSMDIGFTTVLSILIRYSRYINIKLVKSNMKNIIHICKNVKSYWYVYHTTNKITLSIPLVDDHLRHLRSKRRNRRPCRQWRTWRPKKATRCCFGTNWMCSLILNYVVKTIIMQFIPPIKMVILGMAYDCFNHINLDCDFNRNIMEYLLISEDFDFSVEYLRLVIFFGTNTFLVR